jgi:hypothetical protein
MASLRTAAVTAEQPGVHHVRADDADVLRLALRRALGPDSEPYGQAIRATVSINAGPLSFTVSDNVVHEFLTIPGGPFAWFLSWDLEAPSKVVIGANASECARLHDRVRESCENEDFAGFPITLPAFSALHTALLGTQLPTRNFAADAQMIAGYLLELWPLEPDKRIKYLHSAMPRVGWQDGMGVRGPSARQAYQAGYYRLRFGTKAAAGRRQRDPKVPLFHDNVQCLAIAVVHGFVHLSTLPRFRDRDLLPPGGTQATILRGQPASGFIDKPTLLGRLQLPPRCHLIPLKIE